MNCPSIITASDPICYATKSSPLSVRTRSNFNLQVQATLSRHISFSVMVIPQIDFGDSSDCLNIVAPVVASSTAATTTKSLPAAVTEANRHLNIRLDGSNLAFQGRLEVEYNQTWGTVCNDNWGAEEATVVCRQLGYRSVIINLKINAENCCSHV